MAQHSQPLPPAFLPRRRWIAGLLGVGFFCGLRRHKGLLAGQNRLLHALLGGFSANHRDHPG